MGVDIVDRLCGNCSYFTIETQGKNGAVYEGKCSNKHFKYTGCYSEEGELEDGDFGYWDYEDYSAGFDVTYKFGCVHWNAKAE